MQVASITLAFTLLSALVLIEIYVSNNHYVKSVRSFSGLYFLAFGVSIRSVSLEYLSVFRPNAGKYGLEELRMRALFMQSMEQKLL